ncbi:MAG: hypothetical protein ACKO04_09050 [Actinomycetes bacterium]
MTATLEDARPTVGTDAARRLGVPDDAAQVMVLTESSHWDPNWMLTSEQYFRLGVRRTLDKVLDALRDDPRRIWSADCVFFLQMYWERRPERRDELVDALNSGRMRLTTSGVTTQDTLLPSTESVLRDFLVGQEWLRRQGITQEPRLAYFPDSFGHSPALPTLLRSAGFDRTLVTRIDGTFVLGSDWERSSQFPRGGSSAAALTDAGSADFVWRDAQGAEVLAHWHPFHYGQADMLASVGVLRYMSAPVSVPDRSERRVAARLERHAQRLGPLARTRYLLCPIGLDFVDPVPDLLELVDRYNERRYPDTGLWVVNAGADDYLDMVAAHRDDLPVLELDPNPYWTGFYASRPELKRSHRLLVDRLLLAEADGVADGDPSRTTVLAGPWWTAATGNHHDFVTGTSPDRVTRKEQEPWLRDAHAALDQMGQEELVAPDRAGPEDGDRPLPVRSEWVDGVLVVDTGRLQARFDPAAGGCLTRLSVADRPELRGPLGDLVAYDDTGGLWRMGHEYRGGRLRPVDRTSAHQAAVAEERHDDGSVTVRATALLDGRPSTREFHLAPGSGYVGIRTRVVPGDRRTVALSVPLDGPPTTLTMDQPGGQVQRPVERLFTPTYWPVSSWACVDGGPTPLTVAVEMTRALAVRDGRTAEVVVARNATKERAWGAVPILACPARGHEPGPTTAQLVLGWADGAAWERGRAAVSALPEHPAVRLADAVARTLTVTPLDGTDAGPTVEVLALKPADRGDGLVLRLADRTGSGSVRCRVDVGRTLGAATLCDVRERDLSQLQVLPADRGSAVEVEHDGGIVSVRLVPDEQVHL